MWHRNSNSSSLDLIYTYIYSNCIQSYSMLHNVTYTFFLSFVRFQFSEANIWAVSCCCCIFDVLSTYLTWFQGQDSAAVVSAKTRGSRMRWLQWKDLSGWIWLPSTVIPCKRTLGHWYNSLFPVRTSGKKKNTAVPLARWESPDMRLCTSSPHSALTANTMPDGMWDKKYWVEMGRMSECPIEPLNRDNKWWLLDQLPEHMMGV